MNRTTTAALQAAGATLLLVLLVGLVLGLPMGVTVTVGVVAGLLGGGLIAAAAGRAGTASDDPRPGHGPPMANDAPPHDSTPTDAQEPDRG